MWTPLFWTRLIYMWHHLFTCDMTTLYVTGLIRMCHDSFTRTWLTQPWQQMLKVLDTEVCGTDMFVLEGKHIYLYLYIYLRASSSFKQKCTSTTKEKLNQNNSNKEFQDENTKRRKKICTFAKHYFDKKYQQKVLGGRPTHTGVPLWVFRIRIPVSQM